MAGGWKSSDRRSRLPADWPARRRRVLKRDGYQCTRIVNGRRCFRPATDVDHVIPNDDHGEDNLASLCKVHHREKSSAEGHEARRKARAEALYEQEPHPGLL